MNMRVAVLFMVLVASLQVKNVMAQSVSAGIAGLGAASCSDYVTKFNAKDQSVEIYLVWAQGAMSAFNLTRSFDKKTTRILADKTHTPELQAVFLFDDCKRNPKAPFVQAAIDLYRALPIAMASSK